MPAGKEPIPTAILLLADHLDAALARAEDLRGLRCAAPHPLSLDGPLTQAQALRDFVEGLRRAEALLIGRVLAARQRLEDIRPDRDLKALASLFLSGTAAFADAVEALRDATALDFDTGDNCFTYLRARGLAGPESNMRPALATLSGSEDFLVADRIHLGTLMDLLAAFLDALDAKYDLYPAVEDEMAEASAA